MITIHHLLGLSAMLFSIGLYGMLTRRNLLMILLSIELILNAGNLSFVSFSAHLGNLTGQVVVFFTMIVAACEVAVGLAIVILLYRKRSSTDVNEVESMKW